MPAVVSLLEPKTFSSNVYLGMPSVTFIAIENLEVNFTTVHAMWALIEVTDDCLIGQMTESWQVKDWVISNEYGTYFGRLESIPGPLDPHSDHDSNSQQLSSQITINGSSEYDLRLAWSRPVSENTTLLSEIQGNDVFLSDNFTGSKPTIIARQLSTSAINVFIAYTRERVPWRALLAAFKFMMTIVMQQGASEAARVRFPYGRTFVIRRPGGSIPAMYFHLLSQPQGIPEVKVSDLVQGIKLALKGIVDESYYSFCKVNVFRGQHEIFRFAILKDIDPPLESISTNGTGTGAMIEELPSA